MLSVNQVPFSTQHWPKVWQEIFRLNLIAKLITIESK